MAVDWQAQEARYYMHLVNRQPVVIERGSGSRVWDADGKEYLDCVAGWAVNNLGHTHPVVTKAIQDQAATLLQTSNQFYSIPQLRLAEVLIENSCMDKVFFSNSGAEANEGAIKLARKYGKLHRDGAYEIITMLNSFHGRTIAMIAATGQPAYQERWEPLSPGFINVPYNDLEAVKQSTSTKTCAVVVEPLQGEGGVNVPSEDYLSELRQWCDENNLVLIFDEVQTGMGRLGTLWGYQTSGVEPDVMTLAKGLGNGMPVGAFLCKEKFNVLEPGDHGSTFGGNPLATAAANAALHFMLDEHIPEKALEMGRYLESQLEKLKTKFEGVIIDVRGQGLLLAIQFHDTISARLVSICNDKGLLLNPVRPDAIRLMPPLVITKAEVDEAVSKLETGLTELLAE